MLRKRVYPYEYADTWEKFSEISLPSKEGFYSNLNMEDISDIDYRHANNVFKVFKLENLGDYHDLYIQSDTLLLADVFNNFRDICLKECELDPAHFLSLPGLAWQHRIIEFSQEAWLKPYIDMNTELRKLAGNDFEKDLFKLMNNSVFGKTMENIRKHRDIKLVTTDKRRSKLVSEPNYYTLSIIEMKKTKIKMNKPIYLGLSILEISKILMYEFWYDYMKSKYNDDVKLCYMDTDSFVMHIKTNDFYKDISDDVDNRFDTSNYEVKRPLPIGKIKQL